MAVGHDITAYTMAEAFRGKHVSRHSAEEISKALGVRLEQAFRIEGTETTLTGKTLREYALFARQVLQFASDQYGTVQPAFSLPARGTRPRFVDCLHDDEVKQLLNYLPKCSMLEQTIVQALLNTGMRRGELAGLTWEDVNFKQCTVHVYKSLLVFDEFGYQLTTTKESNDRYIDVAPEFMAFMKKCYELWRCQRKMMGASWQNSIEKKRCKYPDSLRALAANHFVICDDHGWPLSPDSYAAIVKRIGNKAGIRHLHPHMFRHTFVSILMSNPDIGVATVAAEAGHAQPSTTLMIYTQQYKKRQESIRNQLSRELYGA
ncbi:MAG: site-specific integrase [Gemmiger sp.]